jgi:hypothetical protein
MWDVKMRRYLGRRQIPPLLPCIRGSRRECASVALAATHCGSDRPGDRLAKTAKMSRKAVIA